MQDVAANALPNHTDAPLTAAVIGVGAEAVRVVDDCLGVVGGEAVLGDMLEVGFIPVERRHNLECNTNVLQSLCLSAGFSLGHSLPKRRRSSALAARTITLSLPGG